MPVCLGDRALRASPGCTVLCCSAVLATCVMHLPGAFSQSHSELQSLQPCSLSAAYLSTCPDPSLPNPAPIPASLALAWHGVYARALPCCVLPNAVCGKQTVSTYHCVPQKWCVCNREALRKSKMQPWPWCRRAVLHLQWDLLWVVAKLYRECC